MDNFELFTNCSVGGESKQEGWEDAEPITQSTQIVVETSTDLNTRLNLYDENFAQEMAFNRGGSSEDYQEYSNRSYTFNFATKYYTRDPGKNVGAIATYSWKYVNGIDLVEFSDPSRDGRDSISYGRDYVAVVSDGNRHHILLSNSVLRPNRYYKLYLYGNAKEIRNGLEVDPYSMDIFNGTYDNYPWSTMKVYYFRTGNFNQFTSNPEIGIQDDVALAFPSPDGHMVIDTINATPVIQAAYKVDISRPNIAFLRDISSKFDNSRLKWALYDETSKKYVSEDIANYKSSYVNENLNWLPDKKLIEESNLDPTHTYVIKLEYVRPKTAAEKKAEADAKAAEEAAKAEEEAAKAAEASSSSSQSSGSSQKGSGSSGSHYFVHGGVVYEEGSVHKTTYESQLKKKKQLSDALKVASTSGSSSSGSSTIKRTTSSGTSTIKRATSSGTSTIKRAASTSSTSSSSSSNAVKSSRARKATTKYLPPMMQNPVRGNVNTRMVGDMNKTGKVGNGGARVVNQQPSIAPTTNVEKATQEFSANVNSIMMPNNVSASANIEHVGNIMAPAVVVAGAGKSSAGSKVVGSGMMRPSSKNISLINPVTKVEAKVIEDKVDMIVTSPIFSNRPSSKYIPDKVEEILTEIFPDGRPSKVTGGKMTIEEIMQIIESKGIDRVRPDIIIEGKIDQLIEQEIGIAGHHSSGSGGGSSSSSSSSQSEPWKWPEPTDQENKHVLLFGVRVMPSSVTNPVTEEINTTSKPLPYSYPFMGDMEVGIEHKYNISVSPNDYEIAFDKGDAMVSVEGESGKKSIRMIDPYYYYNYLGGYANASGWEAKRYKYDYYPNLSTKGLEYVSKYHTVTPTLAASPQQSFELALAARNYRNYTNPMLQLSYANVGSFAAKIGGISNAPIPSRSNFPEYTWLTDEGMSWILPVDYLGFGMYRANNTQLVRDIYAPYTQLSNFVEALHRTARYFHQFFEGERGWFNDIYRGCYINASSNFITSKDRWQDHWFQSDMQGRMYYEIKDSLNEFHDYNSKVHPYYYNEDVKGFIDSFCWKSYSSGDVMKDFTKFKEDLDKIYSTRSYDSQTRKWSWKISDKKGCLNRIKKYKKTGDEETIYYTICDLLCYYDDFYNKFQGLYRPIYDYNNPQWDELWASYLREGASMYDDQYMFQMPYEQIPLMYASQYKGKNNDKSRTKLEEVLVGMSGNHPRRNRDEAATIWKRMEGTEGGGYTNYEKFDKENSKYVKGITIKRHRVNTFNFKKGAYEVYDYPGNEKYPASSKQVTIGINK